MSVEGSWTPDDDVIEVSSHGWKKENDDNMDHQNPLKTTGMSD